VPCYRLDVFLDMAGYLHDVYDASQRLQPPHVGGCVCRYQCAPLQPVRR
jgi:hypothetical protein